MEKTIKKVEFRTPTQPKYTRVAAYARVSSGKDAMLHSLSVQVSFYSNMIQNHKGWTYAGVYSDEAFTGTKANREGFQSLLTDCRAGKIDMVITKSISRFARNTVTLLDTVRELKSLGIDVFFEEQNIHTMSGDGELLITILASYAQEESLSASENQKWRIRHGFEQGELINWRFMYGYNITKDGVEINSEEAEVVREIYRRVSDGEAMNAIAKDLNRRLLPRPLGGKWTAVCIHALIVNEKYLGNALSQKTFINNHLEKKQMVNSGELPMYYAEGTHDAIVSKALFDRANAVVKGYADSASGRKPLTHDAFTGKIRCCQCGNNYKRILCHGREKYQCRTFQEKGKAECTAKAIPIETLFAESAAVLGISEFDEDVFSSKIQRIEIPAANRMVFVFKDGTTAESEWKDRSRSNSWTPEMREAARQRVMKQRRKSNE